MKTLVTGASGFLGGHIISQLLEQGHHVVGVLRNPQKFLWPTHPNLELHVGDITDSAFMDKAMRGCTYVIHAAATTSQRFTSYKPYEEANVKGTATVIKAAVRQGVKRMVYVSTANTIGYGTALDNGAEDKAMQPPFTHSWYAQSKKKAEDLVLSADSAMECVIVHPTFMLGAYDGGPSSGVIVLKGYQKKIILCPSGGKNFVYVQDVAKAAISALEKGENKASYLLCGHNMSYRAFFELLAKYGNVKPLFIPIPQSILLLLGALGSTLRSLGVPLSLSWTNAKILGTQPHYSNAKASQQLGVDFQPVELAIKDAVEWFLDRGMLKK